MDGSDEFTPKPEHPLAGLTLLLVEDDLDSLEMYRYAFKQEGLRVLTASTLAAARLALQTDQPAALVCDLLLPDGEAFEMIATARQWATQTQQALPIIVVTACVREEARLEALRSGCDQFLLKPAYPDQILNQLTLLLVQA